ncbi:MAG: hypothetical protein ACFFAU_20035 [Candidatus Hodarchaeota archaeon]
MSEKTNWSKIQNIALLALPLAMGVSAIVLAIVSALQGSPQPDMSLPLGLGLSCLAIYGLDKETGT